MRVAEELRYLVLAAQREGYRLLAHQLRPLGITPSQAEALRVLSDHQPLTLGGLGELLVCETGNNPSRLVDRLVSLEFIERRPSEVDKRRVELTLTAGGEGLVHRIVQIEESIYERIDAASGGPELDEVLNFLRRLVADLPAGQALARRVAVAGLTLDRHPSPRSLRN